MALIPRLLAVLACTVVTLSMGSWSANSSTISSNEGSKAVSGYEKVRVVSWHLTNDEFIGNPDPITKVQNLSNNGHYTKPLILSDDTQQADSDPARVATWMNKLISIYERHNYAYLGQLHYEHLDTNTLPSMRADPTVMASLDAGADQYFTAQTLRGLAAIKSAVRDSDQRFKDAVNAVRNSTSVNISSDGTLVTCGGRPAVLIGFSGYGTMIANGWRNKFAKLFSTLHENNVNFTRVFVTDMYTAANRKGFRNHDAVIYKDKGAVPFSKDLGLQKYDLYTVSDDFLARLTDFVTMADQNGIVVQLSLFDYWDEYHKASNDNDIGYYGTWLESPYNARNNSNGFLANQYSMPDYNLFYTSAQIATVNTRSEDGLLPKIFAAVGTHKNVIYEIINEPTGKVPAAWQTGIADFVDPYLR